MSSQADLSLASTDTWLRLLVDGGSFVVAKNQVHSLDEANQLGIDAHRGELFMLNEAGWPVFDIDLQLDPQPVVKRRFLLFLKNLAVPVGILADEVDILMAEDVKARVSVPGVFENVHYLKSMLILRDESIVAEVDAMMLGLHLYKSLPEGLIETDAVKEENHG